MEYILHIGVSNSGQNGLKFKKGGTLYNTHHSLIWARRRIHKSLAKNTIISLKVLSIIDGPLLNCNLVRKA